MKLRRTLIAIFFVLVAACCAYVAFAIPADAVERSRPTRLPHPGGAIAIGAVSTLIAIVFWFRRGTEF